MEGKLLVFCDEDVTLDEYGNRLSNEKYKDILSCLELDLPMETANTPNRDIFFIDWKTFMPDNLEYLNTIKFIGIRGANPETDGNIIFEGGKTKSLMERVCLDTLKKGSSIDFPQVVMNDFFNRFTDLLEQNTIVQILPCYSENQDENITLNRRKIMHTWNDRNQTFLRANCRTITKSVNVDVLGEIRYSEFSEVYKKASNQMIEIMSRPDFAEDSR